MTELDAAVLEPAAKAPAGAAATAGGGASTPPAGASPTYVRRIATLTLRQAGARLGLVWIGLLVLFAVFAPFIANTHPILMKQGGRWSSPLLRHLTPQDVVLQVAFWTAVVLVFLRRWSAGRRTLVLLGVVVLTGVVAAFTVKPPEPVIYDIYRVAARDGQIERAIYTPIRFSPEDHLSDQIDARLKAPRPGHLLGTTYNSADLASNMIYASRVALSIGFVSTGIAAVIGVVIGGLMGYFAGWVDLLGMRLVEVFESIPQLLLLLIFAALFQDAGPAILYVMMAVIGLTSWVSYAQLIRAEFLSLRTRDFVQAARAAGLPVRSILFRHMLPNGITPIITSASFGVAGAILSEAVLSFLGIGIPTEQSWGTLLNEALGSGGSFFWWLALYPGAAIFLTVFSYNLIGESLRDAMDPRLNKMME